MSKKKALSIYAGYGWTTKSPAALTDTFQKSVARLVKLREELGFDAIAFRGSSGAALAFVASIAMQIPIIFVRKNDESNHGNPVESNSRTPIKKYIIVDDFVCSGKTLQAILDGIRKISKQQAMAEPKCVGAFLYSDPGCDTDYQIGNDKKKETIRLFRRLP